jgi:hypothetical protein
LNRAGLASLELCLRRPDGGGIGDALDIALHRIPNRHVQAHTDETGENRHHEYAEDSDPTIAAA